MTYGYARVSTTDQHLEVQRVQLQQAGCDIIYEETASGVDDNRLALASMLYVLNSGDTVVVCKLDRIARSTRHLLDIVDDWKQNQLLHFFLDQLIHHLQIVKIFLRN